MVHTCHGKAWYRREIWQQIEMGLTHRQVRCIFRRGGSVLIAKIPLLIAVFFLIETCLDALTAPYRSRGTQNRAQVVVLDNSKRISHRLKLVSMAGNRRRRA